MKRLARLLGCWDRRQSRGQYLTPWFTEWDALSDRVGLYEEHRDARWYPRIRMVQCRCGWATFAETPQDGARTLVVHVRQQPHYEEPPC